MTIQVSLPELFERAVLDELQHGRPEESWAALRQIGVPDSAEVTELAQRLKAAHTTLERISQEMQGRCANQTS